MGRDRNGEDKKYIESMRKLSGRFLPIFSLRRPRREEIEFWAGQNVYNGESVANVIDRRSIWYDNKPFCLYETSTKTSLILS